MDVFRHQCPWEIISSHFCSKVWWGCMWTPWFLAKPRSSPNFSFQRKLNKHSPLLWVLGQCYRDLGLPSTWNEFCWDRKWRRNSVSDCCSTQGKKNQEEANLIQGVRETTPQKGCVLGGLKYPSAVREAWGGEERKRAVIQEDGTEWSKVWRGGNGRSDFWKISNFLDPQTEIMRHQREHARHQASN